MMMMMLMMMRRLGRRDPASSSGSSQVLEQVRDRAVGGRTVIVGPELALAKRTRQSAWRGSPSRP